MLAMFLPMADCDKLQAQKNHAMQGKPSVASMACVNGAL